MEDRFQHTIPGAEVNETDVNLFATEASLADDRVFAELFRLTPNGAPSRGILSASYQQGVGGVSAIVVPSGSANATVIINPFRAIIGPTAPTLGRDFYREIRSALCVGNSSSDMRQYWQFAANASNYRWDLLYVRVDVEINGATVSRFVKTGSTASVSTPIVSTLTTTATLGVVQGTASATPAKPVIPADSGSSYYIPIAYVYVGPGHTLTTSIVAHQIDETAPVLHISHATGAASLKVANGMNSEAGVVLTNETWAPPNRPPGYMSPTMGGKKELIFSISEVSGFRTIALGATGVIDDTIDWRKRMFRIMACLSPSAGGGTLPWAGSSGPCPTGALAIPDPTGAPQNSLMFMGQSFVDDGTAAVSIAGGMVANVNNFTTGGKAGSTVQIVIYVDLTDGKLKAHVGSTDPNRQFFFWLEATGQFNNA